VTVAEFAVNFFVALFALVDPIGNVPLFAAATEGARRGGRRLTALYIAAFAFAALTLFFLTGLGLLAFFGVSMPAFQIAGGILLLLMGLDMVRGNLETPMVGGGDTPVEQSAQACARERFKGLVAPFGMPLLIGPGAISTAIIYAEQAHDLGAGGYAAGVGVIFAVCLSVAIAFWFTDGLSRLLGPIGMAIIIRVLGLILCAMAVQFMLIGFDDATHGVFRHAATHPPVAPVGQKLLDAARALRR
jgi:multiple antibiotic resistance protein